MRTSGVSDRVASLIPWVIMMCECVSMIPGMRNFPDASMTVSSPAGSSPAPISANLPPAIRTSVFSSVSPVPVRTVPPVMSRSPPVRTCAARRSRRTSVGCAPLPTGGRGFGAVRAFRFAFVGSIGFASALRS